MNDVVWEYQEGEFELAPSQELFGVSLPSSDLSASKIMAPLAEDERIRPFLADIQAEPANEGVRLIFADWLEDHGERALSAYLRLDCHFGKTAATGDVNGPDLALQIRRKGLELIRQRLSKTLDQLNIPPLHRPAELVPAFLGEPRLPPVRITYDVEGPGSLARIELPFVVGVLADLTGEPGQNLSPLEARKFTEIDAVSFNDVLRCFSPRLAFEVPNHLDAAVDTLAVELTFSCLEDFSASRVAFRIPRLRQRILHRSRLPQSSPEVKQLDQLLSRQLAAVLHHPSFQRLEAAWRGLGFLVSQTRTSENLLIRALSVTKKELREQFDRAKEVEESCLYQMVCRDVYPWAPIPIREPGADSAYYTGGGAPFGLLIGDYEFGRHPEEIHLLKMISNVAAAAHAPFIAAASPRMFGLESFTELSNPRDLARSFQEVEYASWKSFRYTEDSRYVALTLPRVLGRLPYGESFQKVDELSFEELVDGDHHDKYLWMNAAWAYGTRITDAFARYGWLARTRGVEGGGRVEGLSVHTFANEGDPGTRRSTEVALNERREYELGNLGFLPLLQARNRDYAMFLGASSCHKPSRDVDPGASARAALAARIHYILCLSRFMHYFKAMARSRIGSFMEPDECERWLHHWVRQYCTADPATASPEMTVRYPLREASVEVREIKGKPGCYEVIAFLYPHFQLEVLDLPMRLVAEIPQRSSLPSSRAS